MFYYIGVLEILLIRKNREGKKLLVISWESQYFIPRVKGELLFPLSLPLWQSDLDSWKDGWID